MRTAFFTLTALLLIAGRASAADFSDTAFFLRFLREAGIGSYTPEMRSVLQTLKPEAKQFVAWPPNAAHELGLIYRQGEDGVPQNDAEAFRWLSIAANQGHTNALYELAQLALLGRGTRKDIRLGEHCLTSAANKGHAGAQAMLGSLYAGMVRDVKWQTNLVESTKWFIAAKANGNTFSLSELAKNEEQMTPAQIAEAQRRALVFHPKEEVEIRWTPARPTFSKMVKPQPVRPKQPPNLKKSQK